MEEVICDQTLCLVEREGKSEVFPERIDTKLSIGKLKNRFFSSCEYCHPGWNQGGITRGAIDEPRKSSKAIDERVIINFCDTNVVNACFCDKHGGFIF